MERPIFARILTESMRHNLAKVKTLASQSKTWSIVKANAYGHGLEASYEGFASTDGFGLLDLSQAKKLRELGWRGPILLIEGIFSQEDLEECMSLQCDMAIHHIQQIEWIEKWVKGLSGSGQIAACHRITVWLKMNSGMNRLGILPVEYRLAFHRLHSLGFQVNHMTHFANADEVDLFPTVDSQWEIFTSTTENLPGERTAANSAAILWHQHTQADWCRPGIMLYGASPTGMSSDIAHAGLKPAMELQSKIISIQTIQKGANVGYGGRFQAQRESKIAVIACGYADGYPRHAPDGSPVWVGIGENLSIGKVCPLAGKVSMDLITVDITDFPDAGMGSSVELWGTYLPIDDVARASQTVGYELMCALAPRVPVRVAR